MNKQHLFELIPQITVLLLVQTFAWELKQCVKPSNNDMNRSGLESAVISPGVSQRPVGGCRSETLGLVNTTQTFRETLADVSQAS